MQMLRCKEGRVRWRIWKRSHRFGAILGIVSCWLLQDMKETEGKCQTALHCNMGDLKYIMGKFFSRQLGCLLCSMSLLELLGFHFCSQEWKPSSCLNCKYLPPGFHIFRSTMVPIFKKNPATVFHGACHRSWFFSLCGCMDVSKPGLKCRFIVAQTNLGRVLATAKPTYMMQYFGTTPHPFNRESL